MSQLVHKTENDTVERLPSAANAPVWRPDTDVIETAEGFRLLADLPGADPESLVVEIERNILSVQAKTRQTEGSEKGYREFEPGDYYRTFRLGYEANPEKVEAKLTDGVLCVHLPKADAHQPKRIAVNVGA